MSNKAQDYAWRLRVHDKSTPRKYLLIRIAAMVSDDTMSCFAKVGTLAAYLDIDPRRTKEYVGDLSDDGNISVLERTRPDGMQRESRIFMHGPWDAFGGTGEPFPEITLPKSSTPMDPTQPIKVTPEMRAELRRRYTEYAEEFGCFPDGTPRCRWRTGSRAHAIVCWYGVGNIVIHDNRPARVTAITNVDVKNRSIPEQARLTYLDDRTESDGWVLVSKLSEPGQENPSSGGGDGIGTPGVTESAPHGVTESAPHGVTESAPHESSLDSSLESSSSRGSSTPRSSEEEEERPSANKRGIPVTDLVLTATDATLEEAQALVDVLRLEAKKSLGGYVRKLAANGDLEHRLWRLRRQSASQSRTAAPEGSVHRCSTHGETLPCGVCKTLPRPVLVAMLRQHGPERRPDLAEAVGEPAGV